MDTVSESKETTTKATAPRVTADHFEVVTAAIAAKREAIKANDEAYKQATEKLDELDKEIQEEKRANQLKADGLYLTREAVRNSYHAEAKRIERDYRVAVYGEAQVLREEEAESRRRRDY